MGRLTYDVHFRKDKKCAYYVLILFAMSVVAMNLYVLYIITPSYQYIHHIILQQYKIKGKSSYVPPHLRNRAGGADNTTSTEGGGPPQQQGQQGGYNDRRSFNSSGRGSFNRGGSSYGRGGGDRRSYSQGGGQPQQNSRFNSLQESGGYGGDRRGEFHCA